MSDFTVYLSFSTITSLFLYKQTDRILLNHFISKTLCLRRDRTCGIFLAGNECITTTLPRSQLCCGWCPLTHLLPNGRPRSAHYLCFVIIGAQLIDRCLHGNYSKHSQLAFLSKTFGSALIKVELPNLFYSAFERNMTISRIFKQRPAETLPFNTWWHISDVESLCICQTT